MSAEALVPLVAQYILYPGLLFVVAMVVFTQWIARKVSARVMFRYGPTWVGPFGLLQPLADFLKLLAKEDLTNRLASRYMPIIATSLAVGALTAILLFTPVAPNPIAAPFDIVPVLYLLVWSTIAIAIVGMGTPNPYSNIGVGRYLALLASSEPALLASYLVPVILSSKLPSTLPEYSVMRTSLLSAAVWGASWVHAVIMAVAFVAAFLATMAVLELRPFDIPEAETEIYWGMFTEYGGPRLALTMFVLFTEKIVLPLLFTLFFLGGPAPFSYEASPVAAIITIFLKYLALFVLMVVIDTMMPRFRPDQAIRFLWKYVFTLSFIALLAAIAA